MGGQGSRPVRIVPGHLLNQHFAVEGMRLRQGAARPQRQVALVGDIARRGQEYPNVERSALTNRSDLFPAAVELRLQS
jgi:hypothetical protein